MRAVLVVAAMLLWPSLSVAQEESGPPDDRPLIRIVDALDIAVDTKRWEAALGLFTTEVFVDVSELTGAEAGRMAAEDLVSGWEEALAPPMMSFHLRGNHQVQFAGDNATVTSHGYAWNRNAEEDGSLWEVWGVYEHGLERTGAGWRINRFVFRPTHERGPRPGG